MRQKSYIPQSRAVLQHFLLSQDLRGGKGLMTAQEKAKQLRYKKAVLAEFNLEAIQTELYDISEECDESDG